MSWYSSIVRRVGAVPFRTVKVAGLEISEGLSRGMATHRRYRKTVETATRVPIPPTVIMNREITSPARTDQVVFFFLARLLNAFVPVMFVL
jgi:hypothetical protein